MKGPFLPRRISLNGHEWIWVNNNQLNRKKYDQYIDSRKYWPFMYSWYWDAVCPNWGAYVRGEYLDVFPICRKWKLGIIPILVTPNCVKWVEGNSFFAEHLISQFLGLKNLAFSFDVKGSQKTPVQILCKNELWKPSRDLKRNLRKAEQNGYEFSANGNWESFAHLMKNHHPFPWKKIDESGMEKLYRSARALGYGFISEVKLGREVVASQFFILHKSQLLFVQNVTHENHKVGSPMAQLIYSILEKLGTENIYPDVHFMGSANPGVAGYNKKFGATDYAYFKLKNY